MLRQIISCFLVFSVLLLTACSDPGLSSPPKTTQSTEAQAKATPTKEPVKPPVTNKTSEPTAIKVPSNPLTAKLPQLNGSATVQMKLKSGTVTIEVDGNNAPITAGNFVDLVSRGVYNGLTFHRVVKDPSPFVAQGGDPLGNGTGSFIDPVTAQPRYIPLEILPVGKNEAVYGEILPATNKPKLQHSRGAIAMARSQMPNSASSQFYFALADIYFLDGSYAVFGYVTNGMDLVDGIQAGDRIESMTIVKGAENLKQPA
ncbi:peptidylprolyl isomerase [Tumidithrix elongata RA019]|uniref:Peptidyl-prolyl cis-trans isomerase n=1 Tax=Tumidithrix elongata BACA0141 TaxID=2716417 RepID=A0AAW9PU98_9CYAN|nr:peptidylprolyl isomerase [Tumidithrix elongata RA019]